MPDVSLPRLLYVGDVPVESTIAGAALLYRLFDGYPADRLTICQSDLAVVRSPERRLPGVVYHQFAMGSTRLLYSRVSGYYGLVMLARAEFGAGALAAQLGGAPAAVVTVAHAFSWLRAAKLARLYRVPLHLIVHDDCLSTMGLAAPLRGLANARFGQVYRSAASRFCVSPTMGDEYAQRYGVTSRVLYPSRARNAVAYELPPSRDPGPDAPFTVAFAGSLMVSHLAAVQVLAQTLESIGGRLEIHGASLTPEVQGRLASSVVSFHPFLPWHELSARLRERADLLFLPMSFEAADTQNMTLCFPTKLADYTALGVPILVAGPTYCAAVRWARDNRGVAEVAVDITQELPRAVTRLAGDATRRRNLAVEALRVGRAFFGHAQAQERLWDTITRHTVPPPA